jgi:hypothetical protein
LIARLRVPVKPHSFYLDVHINSPLLEEAPPEQDDVKEPLPDLQLETIVLPRANEFTGLC